MDIEHKFNDKNIQQQVQNLIKLGLDLRPITRGIAAILSSESEDAFFKETAPTTGKKWPELSEKYRERLTAQGYTGKKLQRSMGGLAQSLQLDFDAVSAAIGTNKIYGALQLWGGLPNMPTAPRAVPARGYLGLSESGRADIIELIYKTQQEALNR